MKVVKYHIAKGTNSHGKLRADTMVRVEIDDTHWAWFTGFADAPAALAFVRELCGDRAIAQ